MSASTQTVRTASATSRSFPRLRSALVIACGWFGLATAAWAEDGFVEETSADSPTAWGEQMFGESAYHRRQPCVGGLGFEVVLGDWPRLLQRGFLDVRDRTTGHRDVSSIAGWCDLGQVRTGDEPPRLALENSTWCRRDYRAGTGAAALRFSVSRLTPAFVCTSQSSALELFAGEKWFGKGGPQREKNSRLVPAQMAYVAGGKVIVRGTDAPVSLAELDEPWVLFWYGERAPFYRTRVPNILWRSPRLAQWMRRDYFVAADLPVLVVFQRRPAELRPTADSLRVTFTNGQAGTVVLMPLLGFYHPPASVTAGWKSELPAEAVRQCRAWARRLKCIPVGCAESRQVSDGGATATVRQRFTYQELEDDWHSGFEKIAPIPPVVALAQRYGFAVRCSGHLATLPIPTHSGPYCGVVGTDTVEFSVRGLDRYLNEEVVSAAPGDEQGRLLVDELRREVARLVAAGLLAPATSILIYGREFHFANPGETLLALAEALPYLDDAGHAEALRFALKETERNDPFRPREVPAFEGARREYFTPISPEEQERLCGSKGKTPNPARGLSVAVSQEARANNVYACWALARAGDQWDWLREHWSQIKSVAFSGRRWNDWATGGHFWQSNEDRGNAGAVNGQFARWIALARIARRFDDRECEERAISVLARTALLRFAQSEVARYMYDEKFQTIDAEPDWMRQLSTAPGESGPNPLWTDHWAGADDDVRQVIRWDECGPVIATVDTDQLRPILPAFLELTPECGRFLGDQLGLECRQFVQAVERNAPDWFVTLRQANLGEENSVDSPRNSLSVFLGNCYALGVGGAKMTQCLDIPFCRVGDLYHLRKLTANLRCLGGLKWQTVKNQ